jgi:hypothetical protein
MCHSVDGYKHTCRINRLPRHGNKKHECQISYTTENKKKLKGVRNNDGTIFITEINIGKDKGKGHPIRGHQGPRGGVEV